MEKLELVVQALQQRVGEIVSQYETHIAVLRADLTQMGEELEKVRSEKEPKGKNKE